MKRVLCPRCDGYVAFDERRCCAGESLFLVCSHCGKILWICFFRLYREGIGIWLMVSNGCQPYFFQFMPRKER